MMQDKNLKTFIVIFILNTFSAIILAQDEYPPKKYSIQLTNGIAKTFHYNDPVSISACTEGCPADEQKASIGTIIDLHVYRTFNSKNSFKLGIGFSE